jgi:5'-nucleotidase
VQECIPKEELLSDKLVKSHILSGTSLIFTYMFFISNFFNMKLKVWFVYLLGFISMPYSGAQEEKIVILHTNDLHSRLNGFAPEAEYTPFSLRDDRTTGGFARLATCISRERMHAGKSLLVVDAGDFLMGTLFQNLEESTGFQLRLMHDMGYDIVTLGNHEFDFGPMAMVHTIQNAVHSGPIPKIVFSSLDLNPRDSITRAFRNLFDLNILGGCHVAEVNGIHVGFFSLLGKDAVSVAPAARPLKFKDQIQTAREYVKYLREMQKADLVICLSHSGLKLMPDSTWGGEDVELARKVKGIDLIISGHTHTCLEKPVVINHIPIVQTGYFGMNLGKLELTLRNRKLVETSYTLIPLTDDIPGDSLIQARINAQQKELEKRFLQPAGFSYSMPVAQAKFPLFCEQEIHPETSNLGMLIADALYAYINAHDSLGADITMFSAGMVRDRIEPGIKGIQTLPDIYNTVCLGRGKDNSPGYPIARVYVTGKELKGILEVLYLAPATSSDYYIYFGGMRAKADPSRGLLRKIVDIEIGDDIHGYRKVDVSRKNHTLYSLTANSYMLEFVSIIGKMSKGLVRVKIKNEKGMRIRSFQDTYIDADPLKPGLQEMKEWQAMIWYLQQFPDTDGNGIPDIPDGYRTGIPRLFKIQPSQ